MKKTALVLSAVLALALLVGCDTGTPISSPDGSGSTTSAAPDGTPAATTPAAPSGTTAAPFVPTSPIYSSKDIPLSGQERDQAVRAYFDSDRYASDHPGCPDAIWFGDGSYMIVPELELAGAVECFVEPELLAILADGEKLALSVDILFESGTADDDSTQTELQNLADHGFPVIGNYTAYTNGYVILADKAQIDTLSQLTPALEGAHYIIRAANYLETDFTA